jgi:hypothetical protein
MQNWGSLAGRLIDPEKAQPAVVENTAFAAGAHDRRGTDPVGRALVGWLHHRQERLGRGCRRVLPGDDARDPARDRRPRTPTPPSG